MREFKLEDGIVQITLMPLHTEPLEHIYNGCDSTSKMG